MDVMVIHAIRWGELQELGSRMTDPIIVAPVASAPDRAAPEDKKTLSVPEAGKRYFDLSRNGSYDAAKRGDIPTIRIGRLLRVPVAAMERKLNGAA
jgi:hypothetical protein